MEDVIIGAIVGAAFGALSSWSVREWFEYRFRQSVRSQLRFIIRTLGVQIGMSRDRPRTWRPDFSDLVQIRERVLSADGARALTSSEMVALCNAIEVVQNCTRNMERIRTGAGDLFDQEQEYYVGFAAVGFRAIGKARRTLGDTESLKRPADVWGLHDWKPYEEISEHL